MRELSPTKNRTGRGKKSKADGNFRFNPSTDIPILLVLGEHRILRVSHIAALTDRSTKSLQRRLRMLRSAGYIAWIDPKLERNHVPNPCGIYALSDKGATFAANYHNTRRRNVQYTDLNRKVGQDKISHLLLVNDYLVAVQVACMKSNGIVRYISQREILTPIEKRFDSTDPILLVVDIDGTRRTTRADLLYGLEFMKVQPPNNISYIFGEADRGSIRQRGSLKNDWTANTKKYEVYLKWGDDIKKAKRDNLKLDESQYFLKNFRVHFFTSLTDLRARNLKTYLDRIHKGGKNEWLFSSFKDLMDADSILIADCLTGTGATTRLID